MEKTQICCLNLEPEIVNRIKHKGFSTYDGSLGNLVELPSDYSHYVNCRPNSDFPGNLHEFEVIICDLTNQIKIDYKYEDHKIKNSKDGKIAYIQS